MPRASAISRMLVESTPCWPNRSVAVWRILWRSGSGGAGVVDFGIVTGRTVTGLAERTPPDWVGWRRVCLPTSQTIGNPGGRMKVGIVGAGSMGSLFGGLLSEAGHDVWLVDVWRDH